MEDTHAGIQIASSETPALCLGVLVNINELGSLFSNWNQSGERSIHLQTQRLSYTTHSPTLLAGWIRSAKVTQLFRLSYIIILVIYHFHELFKGLIVAGLSSTLPPPGVTDYCKYGRKGWAVRCQRLLRHRGNRQIMINRGEPLCLRAAVHRSRARKYLFLAACLLKCYYLTDARQVLREFKQPVH